MLDIGWTEILVVAIVLIVVVGPKDLPPMLRAFGKMTGRLKNMAGEFRQQFDEALKDTEFDDVRKTISDAQRLNPVNSLKDSLNPLRKLGEEIRSDLQRPVKTGAADESAAETASVEETFKAPEPSMALSDTPPVISEPTAARPKKPAARKPRASKKATDAAAPAGAAGTSTAQPVADAASRQKKSPKSVSPADADEKGRKATARKPAAKSVAPADAVSPVSEVASERPVTPKKTAAAAKAAAPKKAAATRKAAAPRKTAARSNKTSDA